MKHLPSIPYEDLLRLLELYAKDDKDTSAIKEELIKRYRER